MPRIKRWFPVSQDINADAEVWAMRRQIGEKSLSIWLEILSISDRNDSELPGDYQELVRAIAGRCQATTRTVTAVFDYAKSRLWLESQPTLRVAKYAKYHRTEERKPIPTRENIRSLPSEPSEPNLLKKPPTPFGFEEFWNLYPKKKSKGDAEKAWKSIKPDSDLKTKILEAVRFWTRTPDWIKDSGQYVPHPATWLRAKGWEDDKASVSSGNGKGKPAGSDLATSQVPAYKPPKLQPDEIRGSRETLVKLKGLVAGLERKMTIDTIGK